MGKKTSRWFLDTNFVTDACAAGILGALRTYAKINDLCITIPEEVYREAIGTEMSEFLSKMALDKDKTVSKFPPLLENDRIKTADTKYAFGAGEDHLTIMAKWFRDAGEKVVTVTSDKKAQKYLYLCSLKTSHIRAK